MPLDDREQRILAEIEAQFYEEDPELAKAVRNISRRGLSRWGMRWAVLGVVLGVVLILGTFRSNTFLALAGFVVMVGSATALVQALRHQDDDSSEGETTGESVASWWSRLREGMRFRRPS